MNLCRDGNFIPSFRHRVLIQEPFSSHLGGVVMDNNVRQLDLFEKHVEVSGSRTDWLRFLINHNPFYVLSACLVLYGIHVSFGEGEQLANGWLLFKMLGGYSMLLVFAAILIVRVGSVWEDARTIVLLVLILLVALSSSFDRICLDSVNSGRQIQIVGFACSIGVIELLLRGVRARLALRYRLPLYAQFALLFYYPTWLGELSITGQNNQMAWGVFLFPSFAGLTLLLLTPAAIQAGRGEPNNGTPWSWPLYPWCGLAFLAAALIVRSYGLSVSFELAAGLQSAFSAYYLIPLLIALLTLLTEVSIGCKRMPLANVLVLICTSATLYIAFPGQELSDVQLGFLLNLRSQVGSPVQWTEALLGLFCAYFWLRGVKAAEWALLGVLAIFACAGANTLSPDQFVRPSVDIGLGFAALLMARGLFRSRRSSLHFLVACQWATWTLAPSLAESRFAEMIPVASLAASWFVGGLLFSDSLAKWIRATSHVFAYVATIAIVATEFRSTTQVSMATTTMLATVALMLAIYWWRERTAQRLLHILVSGCIALSHGMIVGYQQIMEQVQLAGRRWLLFGILFLIVGVLVSLGKTGAVRTSRRKLSIDELNRRLLSWLSP